MTFRLWRCFHYRRKEKIFTTEDATKPVLQIERYEKCLALTGEKGKLNDRFFSNRQEYMMRKPKTCRSDNSI